MLALKKSKIGIPVLLFTGLVFISQPVLADTTWNFSDLADRTAGPDVVGNDRQGLNDDFGGEQGAETWTWEKDGITLQFDAFEITNSDPDNPDISANRFDPYLDSNGGQGDAGLGVCKNAIHDNPNTNHTNNECYTQPPNPVENGADDNITVTEGLRITSNTLISLDQVMFKDADHGTDFTNTVDDTDTATFFLPNREFWSIHRGDFVCNLEHRWFGRDGVLVCFAINFYRYP